MRDARVALALCLTAACGGTALEDPDPPVGFEAAWTVDGCAPWDGPATTVFLASAMPETITTRSPSYPHLWISLYYPRSELPGRTLEWSPNEQNVGGAMRCVADGECETATEARVRVHRMTPGDGRLSGEISLVFPDGSVVEGGFRAELAEQPPFVCG